MQLTVKPLRKMISISTVPLLKVYQLVKVCLRALLKVYQLVKVCLRGRLANLSGCIVCLLHQDAMQFIHLIFKNFGCRRGRLNSEELLQIVGWDPANSTAVLSGGYQPPVISTTVKYLGKEGRWIREGGN